MPIYVNVIDIICGGLVPTETKLQIDKIDSEMINYMAKNGKVNAGELAELVGITVPSTRPRLFVLRRAKRHLIQKAASISQ
jgi:hypothetical protein